jgi:hypothetical protein
MPSLDICWQLVKNWLSKLLQLFFEQPSRFWDFIGTCFMMYWIYRQRGTIYNYDIGGSLQWKKEEIRTLRDISDGNEVLNKNQCRHPLHRALQSCKVCWDSETSLL